MKSFLNFFQRIRRYFRGISIASGLFLIIVGILIIFRGGIVWK